MDLSHVLRTGCPRSRHRGTEPRPRFTEPLAQPAPGPRAAERGTERQHRHLCPRPLNSKATRLGTPPTASRGRSGLPQRHARFCLHTGKAFSSQPLLPPFRPSAPRSWSSNPPGAPCHFTRRRTAARAQLRLQSRGRTPLPARASGGGRIKTRPKVHSLLEALAGYYVFLKISP